jgi:hypothetical protein
MEVKIRKEGVVIMRGELRMLKERKRKFIVVIIKCNVMKMKVWKRCIM